MTAGAVEATGASVADGTGGTGTGAVVATVVVAGGSVLAVLLPPRHEHDAHDPDARRHRRR